MADVRPPLEGVLQLQRALVEAVLMPAAEPFRVDPGGFAARQGLGPRDQAAFIRFQDRLPAYRELVRLSLEDPIETLFPLTRALLERQRCWAPCLAAFLEARVVASPHYRDLAPAFLGWLAHTGWGQDRWPWLLHLAHFELLESLVERHPFTELATDLQERPGACDRVVLDPASQVVAYPCAVTEATLEAPEPGPRPVQLLVHRDRTGAVHWLELTPASAALLQRAQQESIQQAALALGLEDLPGVLGFLADLRRQGGILGFRTPGGAV